MRKNNFLRLLACGILLTFSSKAQTKVTMHLLQVHHIGGAGKWDYLLADPGSNRLYVSHGTKVHILNEKTGDSLAVIPNTMGVHGIALVNGLKKGYTSNGKTGDCTVFSTVTNRETGRIKTGENPDALFYDDFSKKLFVFNGRSMDASVIDPLTDKVIATVILGGKPETGVSDGKGKIYVNLEDKNEVVCFDAFSYKILKRYPLKGGEEPSGLAFDNSTSRLFIGCANKVMLVMEANTGKTISSVPIGEGCDGIAFDPILKQIYSSNGEGTITIINASHQGNYQILQILKTLPGARTISLDKKTHRVFLPVMDKSKKPEIFCVLEYGI